MNVVSSTVVDKTFLAENLKSLFLCCSSVMAWSIESLVKAHRFGLTVEVGGRGNPGYELYVKLAKKIGVEVEEKELTKEYIGRHFAWVSDHTTKNLRAWIPELRDRVSDQHILLPFCFEYHVTELRKREPAFGMPKVDNLYLLFIWSECFGDRKAPLSARVLRDILAWEKVGVISAHNYGALNRDEIRTVSAKVETISIVAQRYLGFQSGLDGQKRFDNSSLKNHSFNARTNHRIRLISLANSHQSPVPPFLVKHDLWEADKTAAILKNTWILAHQSPWGTKDDVKKVFSCLEHRLDGKNEDEIAVLLQFSSRNGYDEWLVQHAIDIDSSRYHNPHNRWISACKEFGIEPSSEIAESLIGTDPAPNTSISSKETSQTESGKAKNQESSEPITGFKHSPDYRFLRLPSGREIALTERQSEVVCTLHEAFLNQTPELSQGHVINEVYGEVSENRLKRLFNDNEVYSALIEPGSRKGLVRLKTRFD